MPKTVGFYLPKIVDAKLPLTGTDGNGSEDCENLFDGDEDTKWCVTGFSSAYVVFHTSQAIRATGYRLHSANDNESYNGRHPRQWTLKGGSSASGPWTLLASEDHTGTSGYGDVNFTNFDYSMNQSIGIYQYYRLDVTEVESNDILQIADFYFFTESAGSSVTVCSGDATNEYVPFYGYYTDSYQKCEFVIPSTTSYLSNLNGKTITSMKFYFSSSSSGWYGSGPNAATFRVFLYEIAENTHTSFLSDTHLNNVTNVYTGTLSVPNSNSAGELVVTFDNNYTYNGGNLLIGFHGTPNGNNYAHVYFYGTSSTNASVEGYSSSGLSSCSPTQQNFLPKTTFYYQSSDYTINVSANPSAGGTVGGGGSYANGSNCTVTATANTGYTFVNWTEGGTQVSTNPSYQFTVSSNRTLVANFQQATTYTVTASANPMAGGTVSFLTLPEGCEETVNTNIPASSYFKYNLSQQIYTPDEIGGGVINSIAFFHQDGADRTRTFDIYMVHTTKDSFSSRTDWITVTSSDKVFSGEVVFVDGEWTTITFDTPFNYDGVQNLALVIDDNTESFDYSPYLTCKAFIPVDGSNCGISIRNDGVNFDPTNPPFSDNGDLVTNKNQILINPGSTSVSRTFPSGASCKLVATANESYNFVDWTENGSTVGSNTTYNISNITGNHTLEANFALDGYTVHAIASPAESGISVSLNGGTAGTDITEMFASNDDVTITATCNNSDYYGFAYWTITYYDSNGDPITFSSTDNPYNLSGIDENYTFTAYFAPKNINSVARWNAFCNAVNGVYSEWYNDQVGGYDYYQKTVYLTANVGPVTNMAGVIVGEQTSFDGDQTFRGTFEGNGKTLTVNLSPINPTSDNFYYCAPFRKVYGATFQNLKVAGSITTTKQGAAGIAGWVYGATFTNCESNVTITNNYTGGDATSGGFVSNVRSTTSFTGCAFTGQFVSTQSLPKWGGFVGWNNSTTNITNCVYAPSADPSGISTSNCATFARNGATITNSYYTQTLGTAQGKLKYNVIPGTSNVTVAMSGTETEYNVSRIKSYANSQGLAYYDDYNEGYLIIAGQNDQVNLTLGYTGTLESGYYVAYNTGTSGSTLNPATDVVGSTTLASTLTMAASNTFIYATTVASSFEITATANPTEGGTITGAGSYNNGATCTLTATANAGYTFYNWTKNNEVVSTDATYSFTVTEAASYVANFTTDSYTITATVFPTSFGTITGAGDYNYGETCTLTVTIGTPTASNITYNFIGWYEGETLVTSNTTCSFNVTSARTLEARFTATITKEILGYNENDNPNKPDGRWYLIASPLNTEIDPENVTNMVADPAENYDLYYFKQNAPVDSEGIGLEWINYKDSDQGGFTMEPTKGYLYANNNTVTLSFTGVPYQDNGAGQVVVYLTNTTGYNWSGWNLVGNPYYGNAFLDVPFYKMNPSGNEIVVVENSSQDAVIGPMEGVFVQYVDGEYIAAVFSHATGAKGSSLALNVTKDCGLVDRAFVTFGGKRSMTKFQLNPSHTKVYIPKDDKDYAIVVAESDMGEMPVNFKAEQSGSYTLSVNAQELSFAYLHLIDNMTGTDVDLLETPSYTFDACTTDYASRFKLVFATGNSNDDNFAFFSNGSFVINNDGEAMLQVVDVNGRIIKSESINGCANINVNAAPGVYMLRLMNGDSEKVQKVVVR